MSKKSILGTIGLALLGGVALLVTKNNNSKTEDTEDDYEPSINSSEIFPKKKYPSDFDLADFCRGGDLTED